MEGDGSCLKKLPTLVIFQSTPSAWRVTLAAFLIFELVVISIHTLRMEGDQLLADGDESLLISIHTLRMEGDS